MAELADAPDLGSGGRPCRFKSCYPHKNRVFEMFEMFQKPCFFVFDSNGKIMIRIQKFLQALSKRVGFPTGFLFIF